MKKTGNIYLRLGLLLFSLICLIDKSDAQKFYLQVASTDLPLGQSMEILFTAENISSKDITLPAFKDFHVVGGPNFTSSTSVFNSSLSSAYYWSIYIQPKHAGICKIEPAVLLTKKGKLFTQELIINVIDPNASASKTSSASSSANKNFFIRAIPSKKVMYKGEEAMVTYKLFFNKDIEGGSILTDFNNKNFNVLNIFNKKEDQQVRDEVVDGVLYKAVTVEKVQILAVAVGVHKIDPVQFNLRIKKKNSSFIDQFFGEEFEDLLLTSDVINIQVKDLPNNAPINFADAIGEFNMHCAISKAKVRTDEPFKVKITIAGRGNLKSISDPVLELAPFFEVYDPQRIEDITIKELESNGELNFEYMITPHEPGNFKIATPKFCYFDPIKQQYITLSCDSLPILISGAASAYSSPKKNTIAADTNIFVVKESLGKLWNSKDAAFKNKWIPISVMCSPLVMLLLLLSFRVVKNRKNSAMTKSASTKELSERLDKLSSGTDPKEIYKECNQILLQWIRTRFPQADGSSLAKLTASLRDEGLDTLLIEKIIGLLEKNEKNIYSPISSAVDAGEVINQIKDILKNSE